MGGDITAPYKKLGDWLSKSNNTIYQAATDGYVKCITTNLKIAVLIKTDGSTPPTIVRDKGYTLDPSYDVTGGCGTLVKKDDYWKTEGASTVFWIPFEP